MFFAYWKISSFFGIIPIHFWKQKEKYVPLFKQTKTGFLSATASPAISLPELPPKPFSNNNNTTMIQMGASMPTGPGDIIASCDSSSVEYHRLENDDDMENILTEAGE